LKIDKFVILRFVFVSFAKSVNVYYEWSPAFYLHFSFPLWFCLILNIVVLYSNFLRKQPRNKI